MNLLRRISSIAVILTIGIAAIACFNGCQLFNTEMVAEVQTGYGKISIVLFSDDAPRHVTRFKELSISGFYDGTLVHRIVPGFIVQAGDPLTRDPNVPRSRYGSGGSGTKLKAEFNSRKHLRGTVAMARSADPMSRDSLFYDTADSQFYICLDVKPHLDGKYTVIGEVIEGMDIVEKISRAERDALNVPIEPIEIQQVSIISLKEHKKRVKKASETTENHPQ